MLYHQEAGMMTLVSYKGVKIPDLNMATMEHDTPMHTHDKPMTNKMGM
jgi:hypothetical protein